VRIKRTQFLLQAQLDLAKLQNKKLALDTANQKLLTLSQVATSSVEDDNALGSNGCGLSNKCSIIQCPGSDVELDLHPCQGINCFARVHHMCCDEFINCPAGQYFCSAGCLFTPI
jgi:hypothetical protein